MARPPLEWPACRVKAPFPFIRAILFNGVIPFTGAIPPNVHPNHSAQPHHPPVPRVASVRPPRTISPALSTQPSRRLSSLGMAPENRGRSSGRSPDHVRRSRTAIMIQTAFAAHASHFLPTHRKSRPSNLLHTHDNLPQICGETLFGCLNDDLTTTRWWPSGGSTVALR